MASEKNYQYLALTVKRLWEKCEKRLALAALAGDGSELGVGGSSLLEPEGRGMQSHSTIHSHSHSTSPRIPRHPAASVASTFELGVQTLLDLLRARLRQGFRCWVTYNRQIKLQDLHSSVLQALQFTATARPAHNSNNVARPQMKATLLSPAPHATNQKRQSPNGAQRLSHMSTETLTEVFQEYVPPARQPKIQPGASLAGSKYCGHSLRLRSKERHVRAKEKKHGADHHEVANALLSLASHHAEKGDIIAQKEVLQRAMAIQQAQARQDHARVQSLETRSLGLQSAELAAAEHIARGTHLHQGSHTNRHTMGHQQQSEKVAALMHGRKHEFGPMSPGHRAREASTDAVLRQLYADQARIDEVIKLASKLWDSGVLSSGPRKPPILKSSLLLRLAERWYHISMRDALQHLMRQGTRVRAAQEIKHNKDAVEPVHEKHSVSVHNHGDGVWQDPRCANPGTNVQELHAECQRLRAEMQAMEEKMAEQAAQAQSYILAPDASTSSDTKEENTRLRDELARLREELRVEREANQHRSAVEQQAHEKDVKVQPAVVEQPMYASHEHSVQHAVPSSRGKLICRILGARHLRPDSLEVHADPDSEHPFVIARVGKEICQTRVAPDVHGNVFEAHSFEFPVNLIDPHQRVLVLKVINHRLFHEGGTLGELEIRDFQSYPHSKRTEKLRNGHIGAELDLELVFKPEYHDHHDKDDDVASVDGDQSAYPDGVLLCRIKEARNVRDTHHGQHEHHDHEKPLVAFVSAHFENQHFRTKVANSHSGNVAWNMEKPFHFQHVDISHLRKQHLYLKLFNHHSKTDHHCIGSVEVHVPKLAANTWVPMRESLHGHGELEFDLRFIPDGEAYHDTEHVHAHESVLPADLAVSEGKDLHLSAMTEDQSVVSAEDHRRGHSGDTAQHHSIVSSQHDSGDGDSSVDISRLVNSDHDATGNAALAGDTSIGRADKTDITADDDDDDEDGDVDDDELLAGLG